MTRFRQTVICVLTTMLSLSVLAAPVGYSINSDSGTADADSLYRLDLATGSQALAGKVTSIALRRDIEGLAISTDKVLYGIDDETLKLFPISMTTGIVDQKNEVDIKGMGDPGGHDFGLSFTCTNELYVTSLATESLYRLDLDGNATMIGPLGARISSIAIYGNPAVMYGMSNGEDDDVNSIRKIYKINMETGAATEVGSLGGQANAADYTESGLAFDEDGQLWAITDRRVIKGVEVNLPSQILRIDTEFGTATVVSETTEVGFESLAVAVPSGCEAIPSQPVYDPDAESVPTLNPVALIFTSLILLLTGLTTLRRFTA